jgi:hypothetical protein
MASDKRKGKVVAESKKKKTRQEKEWDRVLSVPDTQGQPQRGIRIGESAQDQGGVALGSAAADSAAATVTSVRQRSASRADRVTSFTGQVRTSDSWRTHPATADTMTEESYS